MVLARSPGALTLTELPRPEPGPGQLLIKVSACGVCRTDLHVVDGELTEPYSFPWCRATRWSAGSQRWVTDVEGFAEGTRVGVPWLGWTCGDCRFCRAGQENLCEAARFTGYTLDGGYAEYLVADRRYCFPLSDGTSDAEAAPLLCAGLIGYRSLRMAGDPARVGLYGFAAAAHIVAQLANTRAARSTPSCAPATKAPWPSPDRWARSGPADSDSAPPEELDAAILYAPVGALVPAGPPRPQSGPAARVVCAGIHMSPIPSFPYEILLARAADLLGRHLTRRDGESSWRWLPRFRSRPA